MNVNATAQMVTHGQVKPSEEQTGCAHRRVIYMRRVDHRGGLCSDWWECDDCKTRFYPQAVKEHLEAELLQQKSYTESLQRIIEQQKAELEDAARFNYRRGIKDATGPEDRT